MSRGTTHLPVMVTVSPAEDPALLASRSSMSVSITLSLRLWWRLPPSSSSPLRVAAARCTDGARSSSAARTEAKECMVSCARMNRARLVTCCRFALWVQTRCSFTRRFRAAWYYNVQQETARSRHLCPLECSVRPSEVVLRSAVVLSQLAIHRRSLGNACTFCRWQGCIECAQRERSSRVASIARELGYELLLIHAVATASVHRETSHIWKGQEITSTTNTPVGWN